MPGRGERPLVGRDDELKIIALPPPFTPGDIQITAAAPRPGRPRGVGDTLAGVLSGM
ncbi:hypothetical protein ACQPWW_10785 [Micromonospora sp. CA-240977]|uniref:hypothetical protein n=1 Tax=Micromonospora sp. CA-240977 TaxID=3239957 RepID=UPI003D923F36